MDLDAVSQRFYADTVPYIEALELAVKAANDFAEANDKAAASAEALAGRANDLRTAFTETGAAASGAADAEGRLAGESAVLAGMLEALKGTEEELGLQTLMLVTMDERLESIQRDAAASAVELAAQTQLLRESYSGLNDQLTGTIARMVALSAANTANATTQNAANDAARIGVGYWRLSATAIHWIVSGTAELLAVLVPATVAAGAWAAVWLQGATNVYQHMESVYTATEATANIFGVTAGQAVGLGDALQKAQNAANPDVYQALGGAINIVKERFGNLSQVGLQVGKIFDTFTAKAVQDFSSAGWAGKDLNSVLANMVGDLVGVGQVFGNLGHFVLSFASQMPGLAEILLKILDVITGLAAKLIDLGSHFQIAGVSILTMVMGLEEFNRWGSLAVSGLGKLGLATTELSGATGSYFLVGDRFIGILKNLFGILPSIGFGIASLASKIPVLGEALIGTTEDIDAAKAATLGWIGSLSAVATIGIAVVAAGLGFLTYKMLTAQKSWQAYDNALQASVDKSSNLTVFNSLGSAMDQLSSKTNIAASAALHLDGMTISATAGSKAMADATAGATQKLASFATQTETVNAHASALAATYHTSFTGALLTADQAGVKLNQTMTKQAWALAQIKIKDLIAGYVAMGQPVGVVGNDVAALAIQSGLAASKVSQLNQAWDQFMQNLTGGTSGLAGFETSLSNLGNVVAHSSQNLAEYQGTLALSTQKFAQSLTSFTGKGAAAWSNFNQVVGSTAPQMIDWLRTAGAEGAISGAQFSRGVLEMVAQLVPLASKSKAAQAEVLGLVQQGDPAIKTFSELSAAVKDGHLSIADLSNIVSQATIKMGDMSQVAQQLGTIMNTQVASAFSNAALKATGFYTDTTNLTNAIQRYGANSPQAVNAANSVTRAWDQAQNEAQQVARQAQNAQNVIDSMHGKSITITTYYQANNLSPGTPAPFTAPTPGHHLASGTSSARPGVALVGEQGPELMVMRGGEQVFPAHVTRAMMSLASSASKLHGYAAGTGGGLSALSSALSTAGHVPSALSSAAGGGSGDMHLHLTLHLPSPRENFRSVQTQSLRVNRRNADNRLALRVR